MHIYIFLTSTSTHGVKRKHIRRTPVSNVNVTSLQWYKDLV